MTGFGRDTFFGVADESTYGTYTSPTFYVRHRSVTPTFEAGNIEDGAMVAGRTAMDVTQVQSGNATVGATVSLPLIYDLGTVLLTQMFGAATSGRSGSASSPYEYSLGSLTGDSMTAFLGLSDTSATAMNLAMTGAKVASWQVSVPLGDVCTAELTLVAQQMDDSQTRPTATVPLTGVFAGHHCTVSIGGTNRRVRNLTIACDNALMVDRFFVGNRFIAEPLENGYRAVTWDMEVEFESAADWNAYKAALTPQALVATLATGTATGSRVMRFSSPQGIVTTNPLPAADTPGVMSQSLSFMAYQGASTNALTAQVWTI